MDESAGKNKRLRQQNEKDIERDKNMRTIGLIGGMSWESTIPYYRIINEEVKKKMGGLHSAKIILYSVDGKKAVRSWEKLHRHLKQPVQILS